MHWIPTFQGPRASSITENHAGVRDLTAMENVQTKTRIQGKGASQPKERSIAAHIERVTHRLILHAGIQAGYHDGH